MYRFSKILFTCGLVHCAVMYLSYICNAKIVPAQGKGDSNSTKDFFNMDWDASNLTGIPSTVLHTMARGGYNKWQQIPPETNINMKPSREDVSAEREQYVPDVPPVLNYDAHSNLVLNMFCVRGNDNKLLDAGKGKLCAQILAPGYDSAFDAELHRFLSGVLQVRREDINVTKIGADHERMVTIAGKSVTSGLALERLLEVLEPPVI